MLDEEQCGKPLPPPSLPPPPPALATTGCTDAAMDDAELDAAALTLDQHSQQLRSDLLARLLEWKRRAGARQAELEAAGSRAAEQLAAKQQELGAAAAELAREREVLRRVGDALFVVARWRRQHTLGCIAWRAWREHSQRQRMRQARLNAAVRHYEVGRLRRKVLAAWRAQAAAAGFKKAKALAAAAAEAERQRQETAAAAAEQAQRLAEVEAALAAALQARAELEQGMRRAFMRGVCALNLEAMALMKAGDGDTPSDGTENEITAQQRQAQLELQHAPGASTTGSADEAAQAHGASNDTGAVQQQQQQQQWRSVAMLMQKAAWGGSMPAAADTGATASNAAGAWAIPAGGQASTFCGTQPSGSDAISGNWIPHPHCAPATAAAAAQGAANSILADRRAQPAAEQPPRLISPAPTQPVPLTVLPQSGRPATALRHVSRGGAGGVPPRPATAVAPVPCSLPSNVPAHVAAMHSMLGRSAATCASLARPATASTRRRPPAALASAVACGPPPLQVSRRSLAGQQQQQQPGAAGRAGTGSGMVSTAKARQASIGPQVMCCSWHAQGH